MALRLNWKNPNGFPTTIEIYRGDAPLDRANLPAPLVTLPAGTLSWVDSTAAFDTTYYYVFVTKTATDRVVSLNKEITVTEKRGAGPQKIVLGNENYGFFGTVQSSSFFNSTDIKAAGLDKSGLPTNVVSPTWYKFIHRGRVVYVPGQDFGYTTWDALYKAGFVYGRDDEGPVDGHQGLAAVNQLRTLTLDGDTYAIRLMRGYGEPDDPIGVPWASLVNATGYAIVPLETLGVPWNMDSEWNKFIMPLVALTPKGQMMENLSQSTWQTTFGNMSRNGPSDHYGIFCQEREPGLTNVLVRGMNNQFPAAGRTSLTHIRKIPGTPTGLFCSWVPVLELLVDVSV